MRNENAADIYAEEQMPQEIREKIAALESRRGRCRFRLHIKNGWTEHSQPKFRAVPYTQLDWDTAAAPSTEQPGR